MFSFKFVRYLLIVLCFIFTYTAVGYDGTEKGQSTSTVSSEYSAKGINRYHNLDVIWAVNVGGEEYIGNDGIKYLADEHINGGKLGKIDEILGSQDSFIYQSYRIGDFSIDYPIENGEYNLVFKFAEPFDVEMDARLFDVIAQDARVIKNLNVRLARDGNHKSALVTATTDVVVTNGRLNIRFEASKGRPILNALVVRKKNNDTRKWKLVWNDEFNGKNLDDSKWTVDVWQAFKVNSEDQAYTKRNKNIRLSDGKLVIEAHKEKYENAEYTSGRIHSQGKGDFLYGKAEIFAKLPAGQGTWPAIWMLPSDPYKYSTSCKPNEDWQGSTTCDAWPNSGEIDIMEHVGHAMGTVWGTVHNKAYYWVNWEQRKSSILKKNLDQEFHLYSLEWTPEYIHIFLDNNLYFTYVNENTGWKAWPYDHPFHLILNIAVGGNWGRAGGPIDDSIFPVRMEIDYVRVYQLDE
jgi:beta-glucanase (GH16 family)